MFSHVSKELSAYWHGELSEVESRRVAEHLIGCLGCRREFEEIKLGVKLAEQLPCVSAPASIWSEIESAFAKQPAHLSLSDEQRSPRRFAFGWRVAAACAVLLLVVGAVWFLKHQSNISQVAVNDQQRINSNSVTETDQKEQQARASDATWEVARLEGAPKVGANRIEESGRLAVGEWLETDATSRAQISVANIGHVEIEPNSRVQLVETNATEHRLAMTRGGLRATISAPPRLFFVETPSGVAVDLGCSYRLEVDKAGRSILHVTAGWVALELKGRESVVPAGAVCVTQPGKGPGTPYFDDASEKFRDALTKLDFQNGGTKALSIVLNEAREYDTLTLWHLLARVEGAERGRVYDRMSALIPPPQGVTREGVLRLDKEMLDLWKKGMEWAWFE